MRLSSLLVSAFVSLAAVSAHAPSNNNGNKGAALIERGLNLLSKRSTSMVKVSHQRRSRLLAKRGDCPARKPTNGTSSATTTSAAATTAPVRQAIGGSNTDNQGDNGGGDDGDTSSSSATHTSSAYTPPKEESKTPDPPKTTSSSSEPPSSTYTPPKTTSKAPEPTPEPTPEPEPEPQNNAADSLGKIWQFQGKNSGIMSWFRTDAGSDSTNGMSWCETRYQDDWPCFAPSVGTMLKDYGWDRVKAAKAYCGREVRAYNPNNGKSATLFICDGFDDRWVLSPGSIDATIGAFTTLHGSFDWNKNTVVKGLEWEFTGGVDIRGTFQHNKYSKE